MPTFDHECFLGRALESLFAQTVADWELVVVDDGSPDHTAQAIEPFLRDPRVHYRRLPCNVGLGAALNHALAVASAPFVAYLPSDDVFYPEHLGTLLERLDGTPGAVAAYSGMRHHGTRRARGQLLHHCLQLVQVLHRATPDRWVERTELVSDDLERLFWARLRRRGEFVPTGAVSCEWVSHPNQLHKIIRESSGGLNAFRYRFRVQHPLRFHSSEGDLIDEVALYRRFRDRPDTPPAADGLKILLVGELAYNPERVLALEERGHRLYGLWTPNPGIFGTVGPLPFGHVAELPRTGWEEAVRRLRPDLIYALLNWQAVPFAHHVLTRNLGVPFVWHFKEGPFFCLDKGTWPQLAELCTRADGLVLSSPEQLEWFDIALAGRIRRDRTVVVDGDLPKREWFSDDRRPLLSDADGAIHTAVFGRPMGIRPETVGALGRLGIHTHFYGLVRGAAGARHWRSWVDRAGSAAPRHFHLHPAVDQAGWVREASQYDAGWLHVFRSRNGGDIRRATWDDLNYPARMATLASAGVPFLQADNRSSIVATQALADRLGVGVSFSTFEHLRSSLEDRTAMAAVRERAWSQRTAFTFDHHVDTLLALFRRVVQTLGG